MSQLLTAHFFLNRTDIKYSGITFVLLSFFLNWPPLLLVAHGMVINIFLYSHCSPEINI